MILSVDYMYSYESRTKSEHETRACYQVISHFSNVNALLSYQYELEKKVKKNEKKKILQKLKIPSCQNTRSVLVLIDDSKTIKKKLLHLRYIVIPLTKVTS